MTEKAQNNIALIICIQEVKEDGSTMNLGNQLSEEDISYLHQAFIADSISNALMLSKVDIKLFYSPKTKTKRSVDTILKYIKGRLTGKKKNIFEDGRLEVGELGPGRWGQKMDESFRRCIDQGYSKVLLIGSRTPTLTHHMISDAIKILDKKDVVFGPTVEGRYYMIGFASDYHIALADFKWKEANIYSQVVSHIEDRGLSWQETEIWYAVEHPEDVEYLARDINHFRLIEDEETARETEKVLERILERLG